MFPTSFASWNHSKLFSKLEPATIATILKHGFSNTVPIGQRIQRICPESKESNMRRTSRVLVAALFLALACSISADHRLLAADKAPPAAAKPASCNVATALEKLKNLGTELGRAVDIAVELLSNNTADLLSGNKMALLSGNAPTILSGNAPKVLSENTTPILSGNTFSFFSNVKIEIHIENSGNTATAAPAVHTSQPPVTTPRDYRPAQTAPYMRPDANQAPSRKSQPR